MQLIQFAVQQKLTQRLKQLYSNKIKFKKPAKKKKKKKPHTHTANKSLLSFQKYRRGSY